MLVVPPHCCRPSQLPHPRRLTGLEAVFDLASPILLALLGSASMLDVARRTGRGPAHAILVGACDAGDL